jgi:hypothetical protein
LDFNATISDLLGGKFDDGTRQWARQFSIEGRKAHSNIFEFQRTPGKFVPSQGKCKATLEGKLYDNMKWEELLTFDLQIRGDRELDRLLPYDNDADRI